MALEIKGKTQSLKWLNDLLAFFTVEQIKIPTDYRERVTQSKDLLENDTSGIVSSMLDFAIDCALVKYRVETGNENLTEILNNWLGSINSNLRGKVPTGLKALAREYFRERWKGSSNLLLRTFWTEKDDFSLPTTMFFVDGEDIIIKGNGEDKTAPRKLGEEKYYLRLTSDNIKDPKQAMPLPNPRNKNEIIFAQRPFESWSALKTTPFLIRRGLFRNMMLFNLLSSKSEFIIGRAIAYLFALKKGSERLALDSTRPDFVYSQEDLKNAKTDLSRIISDSKSERGAPTYATGFDTEMEHLIPDYSKAISDALYSPIIHRLLAGIGLIDIIQGTASTRKESLLNPKPFIAEVEQGIDDFIAILGDIVETIKEKNKDKHRKYINVKVEINHTPIPQFIDKNVKQMLRSIYDRGNLSRKTLTEVVGELDYELEVQRRKREKKEGHDIIMGAPVIQNNEGSQDTEEVPDDKKTIEKKNFKQALEEAECPHCGEVFDYLAEVEEGMGWVKCPECGEKVTQEKLIEAAMAKKGIKILEKASDLEKGKIVKRKDGWHVLSEKNKNLGGPYKTKQEAVKRLRQVEFFKRHGTEEAFYKTNEDLPEDVKELLSGAKTIWRKAFNSSYSKYGEDSARKIAWEYVERVYKKSGDKWVRKTQEEIEESFRNMNLDDLMNLARLQIFARQKKVLDKILEEEK